MELGCIGTVLQPHRVNLGLRFTDMTFLYLLCFNTQTTADWSIQQTFGDPLPIIRLKCLVVAPFCADYQTSSGSRLHQLLPATHPNLQTVSAQVVLWVIGVPQVLTKKRNTCNKRDDISGIAQIAQLFILIAQWLLQTKNIQVLLAHGCQGK